MTRLFGLTTPKANTEHKQEQSRAGAANLPQMKGDKTMTWFQNYKAQIQKENYMVFGLRLYDTHYYGKDGMSDTPSDLPMNEWMLQILSFEPWKYRQRIADVAVSTIQLRMNFTDRDEANRVWKMLKDNEYTFSELEQIGFVSTI